MIVLDGGDRLIIGGYTEASLMFFFLSVNDPTSRTLRRYEYKIRLWLSISEYSFFCSLEGETWTDLIIYYKRASVLPRLEVYFASNWIEYKLLLFFSCESSSVFLGNFKCLGIFPEEDSCISELKSNFLIPN